MDWTTDWPVPRVAVEGLTTDDWRYLLRCGELEMSKSKTTSALHKITKAEWRTVVTASSSKTDDLETLNLYALNDAAPANWIVVATDCVVESKLDRAKLLLTLEWFLQRLASGSPESVTRSAPRITTRHSTVLPRHAVALRQRSHRSISRGQGRL